MGLYAIAVQEEVKTIFKQFAGENWAPGVITALEKIAIRIADAQLSANQFERDLKQARIDLEKAKSAEFVTQGSLSRAKNELDRVLREIQKTQELNDKKIEKLQKKIRRLEREREKILKPVRERQERERRQRERASTIQSILEITEAREP